MQKLLETVRADEKLQAELRRQLQEIPEL